MLTAVTRVAEAVVVVVEYEVKMDVVEAVVEVGSTYIVSVFEVRLDVANLTNVDIVVPPVVFPAVVKVTTSGAVIVVVAPGVETVVEVDQTTLRVVPEALARAVVALPEKLVAEVIVFTVVRVVSKLGSSLPILLLSSSVNHTIPSLLTTTLLGRLPNVGS